MKIMKYAVNHRWKFSNYRLAFLPGFLQVIAMIIITGINYMVIMISNDVLDIAKDFTALMIIGQFDNIFGAFESRDELAMQVLQDAEYRRLFTVEVTTSKEAKGPGNAPIEKACFIDD